MVILKKTYIRKKRLTFKASGLTYLYMPEHPNSNLKGLILEHRYNLEKKLKRYLNPTEIVIHKNGNKDDNNPKNLKAKTFYRHEVLPISVFNDRESGMTIEEVKKKYKISIITFYRKFEKGKKISEDERV